MALETVILGIADFVSEGISIVRNVRGTNQRARIIWANRQFEELTGWSLEEVRGVSPLKIHGQFLNKEELGQIRANIFHSRAWRSQLRCVRRDGTEFWGDVSITPVRDKDDPDVEYYVHVYRDISEQKERERRADAALAENNRLFAALDLANTRLVSAIDAIPDPFAVFDEGHNIRFFNQAYARAYSNTPEEVQEGMHLDQLIQMADRDGLLPVQCSDKESFRKLVNAAEAHQEFNVIYEMPNDRYYRVIRKIAPSGDIVVVRIDITDLKRQADRLKKYSTDLEVAKAEIEQQSLTDSLTGIGNRRYMDTALADLLTTRSGQGGEVALMHVDLDEFKQINDSLGHAAGDLVLRLAARRLERVAGPDAIISRIGGDEFVVALNFDPDQVFPAELATRVVDALCKPVRIEGRRCRVGASVGVAVTPDAGETAEELLVNSDAALYRAKAAGRGQWRMFSAEIRRSIANNRRMAEAIDAGITRDEFVPWYQIQVDAQTLQVTGAEVLARWQHPEYGLLTPDRFMKVANDLRLLEKIDKRIYRRALEECDALVRGGTVLERLSFNVTARRIGDATVIDDARMAADYPFDVVFELLETAFVEEESDAFRFHVDALRELGVGFEIDDFGSGRASILALLSVQPQMLKIDRRLIAPLCLSPHAEWLVKAVIDIADALDIGVVAEGVENVEQAELLCAMGCDVLQGFLFARPAPIGGVPALMSEEAREDRRRLLGRQKVPGPQAQVDRVAG